MEENISIINSEEIKNLIYTIRGKQVMLDSDVAMLYNCETRIINQTVKRKCGCADIVRNAYSENSSYEPCGN